MNLKLVDFIRSQRDLGNLLIYYDDEYVCNVVYQDIIF